MISFSSVIQTNSDKAALWPAHWGSGYPNVERRVAARGGVTNGHDSATDPGTPPPTLPTLHRTPTC
ncbi:hypothetical protein J6590_000054 [Homalodisca vitripennis]|nr:hypothetical protein J6590_000054 [Homalodisca vitripennis]